MSKTLLLILYIISCFSWK